MTIADVPDRSSRDALLVAHILEACLASALLDGIASISCLLSQPCYFLHSLLVALGSLVLRDARNGRTRDPGSTQCFTNANPDDNKYEKKEEAQLQLPAMSVAV